MENFMMNTDEVRSSGESQKNIAQNFNEAVQTIYNTIESICAAEWKGFSAETFNELTNSYRADMNKLGELMEVHGNNDINSVNNVESTDEDLSSMMKGNL